MDPHLTVDLLKLAAKAPVSGSEGRTQKLTPLVDGVDSLWDSINPHNAMEYAEVVSRELPDHDRQEFGATLGAKLSQRPDFDHEMATNSANHCLRRALDGGPYQPAI